MQSLSLTLCYMKLFALLCLVPLVLIFVFSFSQVSPDYELDEMTVIVSYAYYYKSIFTRVHSV